MPISEALKKTLEELQKALLKHDIPDEGYRQKSPYYERYPEDSVLFFDKCFDLTLCHLPNAEVQCCTFAPCRPCGYRTYRSMTYTALTDMAGGSIGFGLQNAMTTPTSIGILGCGIAGCCCCFACSCPEATDWSCLPPRPDDRNPFLGAQLLMDRLNFRSDDITTLLNDSNTYAAGNRLLDAIQRLTASNKKLLGRLVYNAKRNENCLDAKRLLFCGLRFFWDHEKATYEANFTDTLRDLLTQHLDQSAENQPLNVPVAAEFSQ